MRVLKKYANRRLYDTQTSTYIKLEDVQQLVMQFQPVQVIDVVTNEDITEQILLSIISDIESQKTHQKVLTRTLLEQLIRMYSYDYSSGTPISQFLENALRFYEEGARHMSPLNAWSNMLDGSYNFWQKTFGGMSNPVRTEDTGNPADRSPDPKTKKTNDPRPDNGNQDTDSDT